METSKELIELTKAKDRIQSALDRSTKEERRVKALLFDLMCPDLRESPYGELKTLLLDTQQKLNDAHQQVERQKVMMAKLRLLVEARDNELKALKLREE